LVVTKGAFRTVSGELEEGATIRNYLIVQTEGQKQVSNEVQHLGFQMALSVGYRVRSRMGMYFRNWASRILTEYTQKNRHRKQLESEIDDLINETKRLNEGNKNEQELLIV